jgi:hypothetical protein
LWFGSRAWRDVRQCAYGDNAPRMYTCLSAARELHRPAHIGPQTLLLLLLLLRMLLLWLVVLRELCRSGNGDFHRKVSSSQIETL